MTITPTPGNLPPGSEGTSILYWIMALLTGPLVVWLGKLWDWWVARKKLPGEIRKTSEENDKIAFEADISQAKALTEYANANAQMGKNYQAVLIQLSEVNARVDVLGGEVRKLQTEKLELQMGNVTLKSRVRILEEGIAILKQQLEDAGIIPKFEIPPQSGVQQNE